jgi:hypothetical protein
MRYGGRVLAVVLALGLSGTVPASPAYALTDGVEIPAPVVPRLQALAEAFRAATGRGLVITDGTRRPEVQAQLMLRNLERGDDLLRVYANKKAARAVQDAWAAARKARADAAAILARITEVIAHAGGGRRLSCRSTCARGRSTCAASTWIRRRGRRSSSWRGSSGSRWSTRAARRRRTTT